MQDANRQPDKLVATKARWPHSISQIPEHTWKLFRQHNVSYVTTPASQSSWPKRFHTLKKVLMVISEALIWLRRKSTIPSLFPMQIACRKGRKWRTTRWPQPNNSKRIMSHTSHKLKFQVESVIQKLHAVQTKKVQTKGQFLRQIDASCGYLLSLLPKFFIQCQGTFSTNTRQAGAQFAKSIWSFDEICHEECCHKPLGNALSFKWFQGVNVFNLWEPQTIRWEPFLAWKVEWSFS